MQIVLGDDSKRWQVYNQRGSGRVAGAAVLCFPVFDKGADLRLGRQAQPPGARVQRHCVGRREGRSRSEWIA